MPLITDITEDSMDKVCKGQFGVSGRRRRSKQVYVRMRSSRVKKSIVVCLTQILVEEKEAEVWVDDSVNCLKEIGNGG